TVANVYVVPATGGELVSLTDELDADPAPEFAGDFVQRPGTKLVRWLDAQRVVFVTAFHGHSQLYVGNEAGIQLVDDTARQIVDFDVIDGETLALSVSYQECPSQL